MRGALTTEKASVKRPDLLLADGMMTVVEAADFLRLSRSKLYHFMDQGELAFVRFGEDGRRAARRIPRRAVIELAARYFVQRMR